MDRRQGYNMTGRGYESERYSAPHMQSYLHARNNALADILARTFGNGKILDILDVGCGTGLILQFLACLPTRHRLVGLDFSKTMLYQAREKTSNLDNPPKLLLGDAFPLPFSDNSFDLLVATRLIHQFKHQHKKAIHSEFLRVVRPGGVVVLEFYARSYHWLRYFLGGRKGRKSSQYFSHYPTVREVREIVGGSFRPIPLRIAGARFIRAMLGDWILGKWTSAARVAPMRMLMDEYFIATRKS